MDRKKQMGELYDSLFEINMMINMVRHRLDQMDCGEEAVDESIFVLRAADRLFNGIHDQLDQLCREADQAA